jgi:hypothetical protein
MGKAQSEKSTLMTATTTDTATAEHVSGQTSLPLEQTLHKVA